MQVVDVGRLLGEGPADFVAGAVNLSPFDPDAGQPEGERTGLVVGAGDVL